jgi:hypothetical protein
MSGYYDRTRILYDGSKWAIYILLQGFSEKRVGYSDVPLNVPRPPFQQRTWVGVRKLMSGSILTGYSLWGGIPYEGVSKSFRTGRLERELQMVPLSATSCSCIAILWVSVVSFATVTLCIASQRLISKVRVYFLWLSPETFGYTLV